MKSAARSLPAGRHPELWPKDSGRRPTEEESRHDDTEKTWNTARPFASNFISKRSLSLTICINKSSVEAVFIVYHYR